MALLWQSWRHVTLQATGRSYDGKHVRSTPVDQPHNTKTSSHITEESWNIMCHLYKYRNKQPSTAQLLPVDAERVLYRRNTAYSVAERTISSAHLRRWKLRSAWDGKEATPCTCSRTHIHTHPRTRICITSRRNDDVNKYNIDQTQNTEQQRIINQDVAMRHARHSTPKPTKKLQAQKTLATIREPGCRAATMALNVSRRDFGFTLMLRT